MINCDSTNCVSGSGAVNAQDSFVGAENHALRHHVHVAIFTREGCPSCSVARDREAAVHAARATNARVIIEVGTSFGISILHLGAALRDNGGGKLITTEFEPAKIARARANIAAGSLADLVEVREDDALEALAQHLPQSIDFVLPDGAKGLYPDILSLLEERLRVGGADRRR